MPFFLGGIQVNEPDVEHWLESLQAAGMNTVEVTVYARQGDWDSDHLWFEAEEPSVLKEIRAAKRRGLRVVLILRVALQSRFPRNAFLWHGMIMPRNDSLLDGWFRRYEAFVLQWAQVAALEGVDVLAVGSEMNALTATTPLDAVPPLYAFFSSGPAQERHEKRMLRYAHLLREGHLWERGVGHFPSLEALLDARIAARRAWARQVTFADSTAPLERMNRRRQRVLLHWLRIIRRARKAFPGYLTYAANFDAYQEVAFWRELDLLGLNAYFPLRNPSTEEPPPERLEKTLQRSWQRIFDEIEGFQSRRGLTHQPILFTELGYSHRSRATLEPWSGFGYSLLGLPPRETFIVWDAQPPQPQERALAVRALRQTLLRRNHRFCGLLYWKLTTQARHLPIEPFALCLTPEARDPLQIELGRFADGFEVE